MEGAVRIACGSYNVLVGAGLFADIACDVATAFPATAYFILCDENTAMLFGEALRQTLVAVQGEPVIIHIITPGETSKTQATKTQIEQAMLEHQLDRQALLLAVGGGVVGDIGGFVASTYMRGIRYVHVPTSLLAMVDSSIGGKTGIDVEPYGKNLVGSFHRPQRVYVDPLLLKTLPQREFANGMAEVIKVASIRSETLFALLERHVEALFALESEIVGQVIREAVAIKAAVVAADEKEGNLRAILNFGHSIGHGLEALCFPQWLHGECVAVGMVLETEISRARGLSSPDALSRLLSCLQAYHLPTALPPPSRVRAEEILAKMGVDKKNIGGTKRIVLLRSIGDGGSDAHAVEDDYILRVLSPGIVVQPKIHVSGTIRVPGSKSLSNRVLLMAALGRGRCIIRGLLHSDDTKVMLMALQQLGAPPFRWQDGGHTLVMEGINGKLQAPAHGAPIYLANAGTAARFLTTACTLVTADVITITGNKRMKERPIGPLVEALRANGTCVDYEESQGCLPIRVAGHGFRGGAVSLSANISSQYVSSILLSAPYAQEPVVLTLHGDVVSEPFIEMTVALMRQFGVDVTKVRDCVYHIPNTGYVNPGSFEIEADASSASYPLAMAAVTGGSVTVRGVGTASIQGDAKFCEVLRLMGCVVEQDAHSTTVTGPPPGAALNPINIDMDHITDTFLTAAVVMAACPSGTVSRIINIGNQRVKECDRISAMAANLTAIGIQVDELHDGLVIYGSSETPLPLQAAGGGVPIQCFNDHRIAMSFGVLGCRWPNILVMDKNCTDKTYPGFWDDLLLVFQVRTKGYTPLQLCQMGPAISSNILLIIGMRGSGKTTLGRAVARSLQLRFIDQDELMNRTCGEADGIKKLVETQGWPAFRELELSTLRKTLNDIATGGAVIACGGGVVETPAARELLQRSGLPVVWLRRDIADVEAYLGSEASRPAYGEKIRDVWLRRQPLYAETSTHEFSLLLGDSSVEESAAELSVFVKHVLGQAVMIPRDNTFFLSLTYPDLGGGPIGVATVRSICHDVHAVELRVDLLSFYSPAFVFQQLAVLRRATALPIIYTVRSKSQGGAFAGSEQEYWALLRLGRRGGCAYIDMETTWSAAGKRQFLRERTGELIIASHHVLGLGTTAAGFFEHVKACASEGQVDIIKVVLTAGSAEDCFVIHQARRQVVDRLGIKVPLIVLLMGEQGKISRLLNTFMTPVTHPALPVKAAPGQLSAGEIDSLRHQLGLTIPRRYFLFGTSIALSPSPLMHNTGFRTLKLPYTYTRLETADIKEVVACLQQADVYGGNCTLPHKQTILPFLNKLSNAARTIGAVNTVIKELDGTLLGDNTDWLGIYGPVSTALAERPRERVLILGAGGTSLAACYAVHALGFATTLLWNRNSDRALTVLSRFPTVKWVESLDLVGSVDLIICTLPPEAGFTLPTVLLASKPVIMDVAYRPRNTMLLTQARLHGCPAISGIEMLIEQGIAGFELWTMRHAPRDIIQSTVMQAYVDVWQDGMTPTLEEFPNQ